MGTVIAKSRRLLLNSGAFVSIVGNVIGSSNGIKKEGYSHLADLPLFIILMRLWMIWKNALMKGGGKIRLYGYNIIPW